MSVIPRITMSAASLLQRLEQRAVAAENLILALKNELTQLESKTVDGPGLSQISILKNENESLRREVEDWKQKLIEAESKKGIAQVVSNLTVGAATATKTREVKQDSSASGSPAPAAENVPPKKEPKKEKKEKPAKSTESAQKPAESDSVDIGQIDLRVGQIVNVKKHPDADSLYVEEVDVGEPKPRTVVSGLVKFVPIEEMQNRMAIFMCNLKPAKMRGITSEGMLMCASTPEKVEILLPPQGSVPGDVVEVDGYTRRPEPVLNPKKKIWETVAPDLKTDANKLATYKGAVLTIKDKGPIVAPTLSNVQIK